jgi:hypothetical protein
MNKNEIENLTAEIWDEFMSSLPEGIPYSMSIHECVNHRTCPQAIFELIQTALEKSENNE